MKNNRGLFKWSLFKQKESKKEKKSDVSAKEMLLKDLFLQSVTEGKEELIDQYLGQLSAVDKKYVLDLTDHYNNNALHLAAIKGHEGTIRVLLNHGMNANLVNKAGKLAIHLYIQSSKEINPEHYHQLLSHTQAENLHIRDAEGENILCMLVRHGMQEEALHLLERYPELMVLNEQKESLLHLAIQQNANLLYSRLMSDIPMLLRTNATHQTLLHYAAFNGRKEAVEQLIKQAPELLNNQDYSGNTALHYAVLAGHIEISKILLEAGADTQVRNERDQLPKEITHNQQLKQLFEEQANQQRNSFIN